MVGRDYMLKKGSGPSAPKLFLDTRVVPAAVNAAGGLEVALDRAARRLGIRPSLLLAGMAGLLSLGLVRLATAAARPERGAGRRVART